jgi:hypothetical protein
MAGTVIADNLQAASTSQLVIKNGVANTPPTIQDSAGTTIGTLCRAWVNFNGTGTVAIRASFNVSSITDNGTGDYTVNFTNALTDANYSIASSMGEGATGGNSVLQLYTPVAGSFRFTSRSSSANGFQDSSNCCVAIFR